MSQTHLQSFLLVTSIASSFFGLSTHQYSWGGGNIWESRNYPLHASCFPSHDIRNGFMPHIMGHKLSHIYAREVRWNFEFDSWYSSKICLSLPKKKLHSLYLLFLIMSTLKGDVRVKIFYFTNILFWPYVKKGEYRIEFVCRNVIF
jgi:hypothetical protein